MAKKISIIQQVRDIEKILNIPYTGSIYNYDQLRLFIENNIEAYESIKEELDWEMYTWDKDEYYG